jgi:peptidoglycan LD-endopeptidase LytH
MSGMAGWARAGRARGVVVLSLLFPALVAGCAPALTERAAREPRAAYERELQRVRPNGGALARQWVEAGNTAARNAQAVGVPFSQAVDLPSGTPAAVAYRFRARAGDRVEAHVEPPAGGRVAFLELFEVVPGGRERLLLVSRSDAGGAALRSLVPRAADYVLLVQPRMDGGGRYRVTLGTGATVAAPIVVRSGPPAELDRLHFPVEGRSPSAIGSVFGDPRDGGARAHHGVDIFAPRGTPVLAAADGLITQVANTAVGGRIVWQRVDGTGIELYYAHLDEQHVRSGQQVRAGDPIGTVGNTGNARTTPPHLHFGVYSPGRTPLDPSPLLAAGMIVTDRPVAMAPPPASPRPPEQAGAAPAPPAAGANTVSRASDGAAAGPAPMPAGGTAARADGITMRDANVAVNGLELDAGSALAGVGEWHQVQEPSPLRDSPGGVGSGLARLESGTPVRLLGGTATWSRVALPNGIVGFLPGAALVRFEGAPAERRPITARTPLLERTAAGAGVIETIYGGEHVDVLAVYNGFLLVRTTTGQVGWIAAP